MESTVSFISYFKDSFDSIEGSKTKEKDSKAFFKDFIQYTPSILWALEQSIGKKRIGNFYIRLNDLKYLCAFDEELNMYWYAMRALSGALEKLTSDPVLLNAQKVHEYYIRKYGERKFLKDDNWFENRRWKFLDELKSLASDREVGNFISKYIIVLRCFFDNYEFQINRFIQEIKKSLSL